VPIIRAALSNVLTVLVKQVANVVEERGDN
jgi:hypothetical protein